MNTFTKLRNGLYALSKDLELPDSIGFNQGTNERADLVFQTLDGADLNRMWAEFNETLRIYNSQRDRLVDWLTYRVTAPIEQVRYPIAENFEEASEYGEPVGIRLGQPFNMGFSFKWYDLAIRFTWMFLLENTQAQIEALHNEALEAHDRLIFNQVFKVAFNPTNVTSSIRNIPVTVYKFWNGDGNSPPAYKNYTFDGTHTHYITSGAGTLATAAMTAIEDTLYHHGYSLINGYRLVILVNRQEGKILRNARVSSGWAYDFIPGTNVGGGVFIPAGEYVGAPQGNANLGALGDTQIGTYGPFHVIEEDYIPAGYMATFASQGVGGEGGSIGNPIGIREHENVSGQGLQLIPGDDTYPMKDSFYRHGFGTGIRHRGAGVIMQVTASGTYTVPSAYA